MKLKSRLVLHVNRDKQKKEIRKDYLSVYMLLTRINLSLGTLLSFVFSVTDIKGAFMQSSPIQREVYVRPPKRFFRKLSGMLILKSLPYLVVEAGRQWQKILTTGSYLKWGWNMCMVVDSCSSIEPKRARLSFFWPKRWTTS